MGIFRRRPEGTPVEQESATAPLPSPVAEPAPVVEAAPAGPPAEQVRQIIEVAQRNAEEIERFARAEAERIRGEAVAAGQAHLTRIREATRALEAALAELGAAGPAEGAEGVAPPLTTGHPQSAPAAAELPAPASVEPDTAGARLVALDIALAGGSREEAAAALAEHFPGADAAALIDAAFRRAGR